MNRTTALSVLLALLAVLALAVAAATLDSTRDPSGDRFGVGSGDRGPFGDDAGVSTNGSAGESRAGPLLSLCSPFLRSVWGKLAVLGLFALVFLAMARTTESYAIAGIFCFSLAIPAAILYLVLTTCQPLGDPTTALASGFNGSVLPQGGGGVPGGGESEQTLPVPSTLLGILLVLALVGSVLMLFVATGNADDPEETDPADPDVDVPDVALLGRTAGRAADRIEGDADAENEVFRAWSEMTDHLAVPNPRSSTPAEFAAAAVDAGMAREDVDELTGLFEEVRYGGAAPTEERERRAVEALRRIEATYADDATDGRSAEGSGGDR